MKKQKFLNLKLSEAANILRDIAADETIRAELSTFIDKVGKSSTVLVKEVLSALSTRASNALNEALDKKVNDVKQIVEGGNANVIGETANDGSNLRGEDT